MIAETFSVVLPDSVSWDLRWRASHALRLAAKDLGIDPPKVHWYEGTPPADFRGSGWYDSQPTLGFVIPTDPGVVWLSADLDMRLVARTAAHEAKHVQQLARGETDLGSAVNEANAAEYEAWFDHMHGWRF